MNPAQIASQLELSSHQVYVSTKFYDFLVESPVRQIPNAIKQNMIINLQLLSQDHNIIDPEIINISDLLNRMLETKSYEERNELCFQVVLEINKMSSVASLLTLLYVIDPITTTNTKIYYNTV
jgi:hypothetical protein